jgi:hypothetical protein
MFREWSNASTFIYLNVLFESLSLGLIINKLGIETIKIIIKNMLNKRRWINLVSDFINDVGMQANKVKDMYDYRLVVFYC